MAEQLPRKEIPPTALLGEAFGFSSDDLQANRSGTFSQRQRRQLMREFWRVAGVTVLLMLVPVVVTLILILWGAEDTGLFEALSRRNALIGYIAGVLLSSLYALGNFRKLLLIFDVFNRQVDSVRGVAMRYGLYLEIDSQRFLMEQAVLDLIQNGLHYRIYFSPYAKRVLSVEFAE
jgi:hypothetical protein